MRRFIIPLRVLRGFSRPLCDDPGLSNYQVYVFGILVYERMWQ